MEDLHTQHEDVTGDASRSASAYLTMALVAAQKATDARARRLDRRADTDTMAAAELINPSPAAGATNPTDPQGDDLPAAETAYQAMLGHDQGKRVSSSTALQAWLTSQPLTDDSDDQLVADRAEARLRALHPDAMARYDTLRDHLDPVQAMRQVTPLIITGQQLPDHDSTDVNAGPDGTVSTGPLPPSDTPPAAAAARTNAGSDRPEVCYAPVVREVLEAELAAAVLHDDAWPVLATALERAHQVGVDPSQLLRDVAAQRELASAKHPAQVLNVRLDRRTVTAADVIASSFPTPLSGAPLPHRLAHDTTAAAQSAISPVRQLARDAAPTPTAAQETAGTPDELSAPFGPDRTGPGAQRFHAAGPGPSEPSAVRVPAYRHRHDPFAATIAETAAHNYPVPIAQVVVSQATITGTGAPAAAARAAARPAPAASLHR